VAFGPDQDALAALPEKQRIVGEDLLQAGVRSPGRHLAYWGEGGLFRFRQRRAASSMKLRYMLAMQMVVAELAAVVNTGLHWPMASTAEPGPLLRRLSDRQADQVEVLPTEQPASRTPVHPGHQ